MRLIRPRRPGVAVSLVMLVLGAAPSRAADAPPSAPEPITVRVLGLFCPERAQALRDVFTEVAGAKLEIVDYEASEATVTYEVRQLFPQSNPKDAFPQQRVTQRLDDLVRNISNGLFSIKPRSTTPKDQLAQVEISVGILDCQACCLGVYNILTKVDGVERATVMKTTGLATVWIDSTKTDRAALEAALKKANVKVLSQP